MNEEKSQVAKQKPELYLLARAYEMLNHTMTILTNKKHFAPKYKVLVEKIEIIAINIPLLISEGNKHKNKRVDCGMEAVRNIDDMLALIEILYRINSNFGAKTLNAWKSKICDVKYITLAWIKSAKN